MNIDIMNEDQLVQMNQLISNANNILITCLTSIGKEPTMIVPDQFPDFLTWLPNSQKIVRYDKHREKCDMLFKIADLIFCLDYNTPSRVDEMEQSLVNSPANRVLIDHHLKPEVPAVLTISQPEACSTCELIFRIVWQMGAFEQQTKHFAVPVYCGMMTDTGGFLYNSTRCEIYFIISQLLTKHIDKDRIYRNVYHNYSEDRIRLMGYVLYEKLVYIPEYNAAFYTLTKDELRRFHFIKGDAEGLVNIPQQIKGLKLSISLREDTDKPNIIWVSLRSVDDFPCNLMAEQFFNGGGHLNASGGRINGTMQEAIETVRKAIEAFGDRLK